MIVVAGLSLALGLITLPPVGRRARSPVACAAGDETRPTFTDLYADQMPSWLLERAATLGFERPTAVQEESLTSALAGRDAIVQAKTGSGKTLAYMLPLLTSLKAQASVQALVLLPTRELASQVAIVARRLAAGSPERLMVMALLDGSGAKRQRKWLVAQPPQVIVGNVEQVGTVGPASAGHLALAEDERSWSSCFRLTSFRRTPCMPTAGRVGPGRRPPAHRFAADACCRRGGRVPRDARHVEAAEADALVAPTRRRSRELAADPLRLRDAAAAAALPQVVQ